MRRAVLLASLLVLAACARTAPTDMPRVTRLDGSPVPADVLNVRQPTVVNFWASWCLYCKEELPFLEQASRRYPEIRFVGVNAGEPARMASVFWAKQGMTFPTVLDPYGDVRQKFDIFARPTTIFLNKEGEVVSRYNGPMSALELELRLQELVENSQWQSEKTTPACVETGTCGVR
jgi:thiol-disulfide isomerase/thioredoxin